LVNALSLGELGVADEVVEEEFLALGALVAGFEIGRTLEGFREDRRHLGVGVVGIGHIMLVPVHVEVYLILLEEGHQVRGDVQVVCPKLAEHRVMLDGGSPDD